MKECVIAIPAVGLEKKVVEVGNCSSRDRDKFATIWLTPLHAEHVAAPMVAECFANLECRVGAFVVDGEIIHFASSMP